jgi:hypothetical protein
MRGTIVSALALAVICAIGCGSDDGDGAASGGSAGTGQGGTGNAAGSGGSAAGLSLGGGGTGAGNGGSGGLAGGNEDECDGVDNDGNGIIDDVDVGKDGVCDCLRIATLGLKGEWGNGDIFAAWLDARSNNGATALDDQVLTPTLLAGFQVIVAQDVSKMGRSYAQSEVDALLGWVKSGGGFMTLIGYAEPTELANANLLLGAFGMSYGSQQILQKSGGSTVPVTGWVQHPVTNGVTLIGVDNGYPVQGSGATIATEQGFDLLKAQDVPKGRVLMWGDEWITYDSEWSGHPEYQVELRSCG